jgi:hypothetical protein
MDPPIVTWPVLNANPVLFGGSPAGQSPRRTAKPLEAFELEGGAGRTRLDDPDEGRIERVGLREGDVEENGLLLGLLQIGGQRFLLVKIEEANLPVVEIVLDGLHAVTLSPHHHHHGAPSVISDDTGGCRPWRDHARPFTRECTCFSGSVFMICLSSESRR